MSTGTPKFCKVCGSKLKENSKFCGKCGSKVVAKPAPVEPIVEATPTTVESRVDVITNDVTTNIEKSFKNITKQAMSIISEGAKKISEEKQAPKVEPETITMTPEFTSNIPSKNREEESVVNDLFIDSIAAKDNLNEDGGHNALEQAKYLLNNRVFKEINERIIPLLEESVSMGNEEAKSWLAICEVYNSLKYLSVAAAGEYKLGLRGNSMMTNFAREDKVKDTKLAKNNSSANQKLASKKTGSNEREDKVPVKEEVDENIQAFLDQINL